MTDGVGPAAWTARADVPDKTAHGKPKVIPMRSDAAFTIAEGDPDPRGLPVKACDGEIAGTIADVWVDRSEPQVRYYEVAIKGGGHRLLPVGFVQWPNLGLWGCDHVRVKAITAAQFAGVPTTAQQDIITLREEDRIAAYYAGGHLYATAERSEPLL
jgi:photosynthetic reaction center H subunit